MRPAEVMDLSTLPAVLSVPEVAKILRLSRSQAYEYVHQGLIPCIRLGKSVRIPREPFMVFLEGKIVVGVPDSNQTIRPTVLRPAGR